MKALLNTLGLDTSLAKALEKQGITVPTEIQTKAIPEAIQNKDLIVQSETGTGKTLAYLLPLFHKVDPSKKEMQAIILAPTHELALQILRQIERLTQDSDVKITSAPIIGNVNIDRQIDKLKERPHIIVGSSGRILELIKKKKISAHTVKTIILDEADRLLDVHNADSVKAVIKSTMKDRQLLVYSASISKKAEEQARELMKEPLVIRSETKISVPDTIEHIYFTCEQRDKIDVLRKLIRILNPEKALAFVANGEELSVLVEKLKFHKVNAEGIQGASFKLERKKVMDDFRSGKLQLLVATDLAARGIDIENLTHVFNLNVPEQPNDYLHRAGRTGRKGNRGVCISIVSPRETEFLKQISNRFNISFVQKDLKMGEIVDAKKQSKPKSNSISKEGKTTVKEGKKAFNKSDNKDLPRKSSSGYPKKEKSTFKPRNEELKGDFSQKTGFKDKPNSTFKDKPGNKFKAANKKTYYKKG